MGKVIGFFNAVGNVLYKIGFIIFKIIQIILKRTYRYFKNLDYSPIFKIWKIKPYKYGIMLILVLLPLILSVVSSDKGVVFGTNKTINQVITNELSNLDETKRLDRDIVNFMRKWEIVGASLAIMKNDKLIYCKGYGYADKEAEELCDVKHIFRVASVSKLITAVTIMKLKEEGKLSLSDKVFGEKGLLNDERFLNITDKKVKNITIEQLMRHSAGFSTRRGDPMFNQSMMNNVLGKKPPFSTDDAIEYASRSTLRFSPGRGYNYSNLGYVVLAKVIEKVTGKGYEEYVKDNILAPIGCYDMHIANNNSKDKFSNEVKYYEPSNEVQFEDEDGNLIPKSDGGNNVNLLGAAGGWVGSPAEILKFVSAIDGHTGVKDILSESSIQRMTTPGDGKAPMGWIKVTKNGEWWRTGSMAGTSAMIKRQSNGYTWMFVTNTSSWKGTRFAHQINASVKQAVGKVKEWPERDIFEIADSIIGR